MRGNANRIGKAQGHQGVVEESVTQWLGTRGRSGPRCTPKPHRARVAQHIGAGRATDYGVGREAHSEGHRYHTALGKRELLLCILGPPQAKKSWVRAPYREFLLVFARAVFAFCLEPHIGNSEALAFWPSFRERRSTRLAPRSSWTAPTLASPGGSPSSPLPAPPFCSHSSYAAFAGRSGRTRESAPARKSARPMHFPSLFSEKKTTPEDSRKQFPPPYFLSVSLAAIWHPSGAFFILRQVTVVTLYQGKPSQKKTRARRLFARGRRTAPPPLEVWNGTAKRAHLQVALLAERHVPIKLYAALKRK